MPFLSLLFSFLFFLKNLIGPKILNVNECLAVMIYVFSFRFLSRQYESDELEKSVYQDYDSDSDVPEELKQDYVDEQTGDAPVKRSVLNHHLAAHVTQYHF